MNSIALTRAIFLKFSTTIPHPPPPRFKFKISHFFCLFWITSTKTIYFIKKNFVHGGASQTRERIQMSTFFIHPV